MYFRIALQTPFMVGTANSYAVRDGGGLIMVDAGPDTDEAWACLEETLATQGYAPRDVHTILLTHGHEDHAGLAHRFKHLYGTRVMAHSLEQPEISPNAAVRERSSRLLHELLIRHGAPREIVDHEPPGRPRGPQNWRVDIDQSFQDGETLAFDTVELKAIHAPGHTNGSACFYHEPSGTLFSGDHLIPGVIPNPGIQFPDGTLEGRTRSLPEYIQSLEKLRALPISRLCPGHRDETMSAQAAIDQLLRYLERGQRRALRALEKERIRAYDLVPPISNPAQRMELFLFMYRSIGYLDVLRASGLAEEQAIEGRYYFTAHH